MRRGGREAAGEASGNASGQVCEVLRWPTGRRGRVVSPWGWGCRRGFGGRMRSPLLIAGQTYKKARPQPGRPATQGEVQRRRAVPPRTRHGGCGLFPDVKRLQELDAVGADEAGVGAVVKVDLRYGAVRRAVRRARLAVEECGQGTAVGACLCARTHGGRTWRRRGVPPAHVHTNSLPPGPARPGPPCRTFSNSSESPPRLYVSLRYGAVRRGGSAAVAEAGAAVGSLRNLDFEVRLQSDAWWGAEKGLHGPLHHHGGAPN